MAATRTGLAVVWGSGNLTSTSGVVLNSGVGQIQEISFERSHEETELRNEIGDPVGMASTNRKKNLNITVVPSDTATKDGVDSATANMNTLIAKPGTTVRIVDADSSGIASDHTGDYQLMSCRVRRTNNDHAVLEFSLEQFDDNNITTAIT